MSPSLLRAIQRYTANHVERVPITTDDQSLLAHERDFERWRIAVNGLPLCSAIAREALTRKVGASAYERS
jgi:hypothetical protein